MQEISQHILQIEEQIRSYQDSPKKKLKKSQKQEVQVDYGWKYIGGLSNLSNIEILLTQSGLFQ